MKKNNACKELRGMMKLLFFGLILILLVACDQEEKLMTIDEIQAFKAAAEQSDSLNVPPWGDAAISPVKECGQTIYRDRFENLSAWHHEGIGFLSQPDSNIMQLNCIGSQQGRAGCMAFCRQDFPDNICIEYDLKVLTTNGLVITFIACEGREGQDMITGLPASTSFQSSTRSLLLRREW